LKFEKSGRGNARFSIFGYLNKIHKNRKKAVVRDTEFIPKSEWFLERKSRILSAGNSI